TDLVVDMGSGNSGCAAEVIRGSHCVSRDIGRSCSRSGTGHVEKVERVASRVCIGTSQARREMEAGIARKERAGAAVVDPLTGGIKAVSKMDNSVLTGEEKRLIRGTRGRQQRAILGVCELVGNRARVIGQEDRVAHLVVVVIEPLPTRVDA